MKNLTKFSVCTIFMAFCTGNVLANDDSSDSGRKRRGPPPEAFIACEGLNVGDAAEFEGPRGRTVSGTCEQIEDKLVLRPDRPPRGHGRRKGSDE